MTKQLIGSCIVKRIATARDELLGPSRAGSDPITACATGGNNFYQKAAYYEVLRDQAEGCKIITLRKRRKATAPLTSCG